MIGFSADSLLERHGNGRYARSLLGELFKSSRWLWGLFPYQDRPLSSVPADVTIRSLPSKRASRLINQFTPLRQSIDLSNVKLFHALRPTETLNLPSHILQVVTLHDLGSPFSAWQIRLLNALSVRASHWRSTKIVTDSETVRLQAIASLGIDPTRIHSIPLGIDEEFFVPIPPESIRAIWQRLRIPTPYLIAVGHDSPHKNIARLLQAYRVLHARYPDLPHLVLLGSQTKSLFRGYEKQPFLDRVINPGYVSNEDLRALFAGAMMMLFPSLFEGFGFPPLEAQALGVPVIASEIDVLREMLGDTAAFINPTDVEHMATIIENLLNDSALRDKLHLKGSQNARRFRWEETARQQMDVYAQMLGQV